MQTGKNNDTAATKSMVMFLQADKLPFTNIININLFSLDPIHNTNFNVFGWLRVCVSVCDFVSVCFFSSFDLLVHEMSVQMFTRNVFALLVFSIE